MKIFLPFFKNKRIQTFLAPLFKLIEAVFELLVPIFVAQIIDVGIANNDVKFILTRCAVLVALGVGGLGFSVASQYMSASVATSFAASLRNEAYRKINSLSFSDVDKQGA
ncbi:MAG: ABC transporter ATP-binding protein, partial [Clostridia bacterium]|nr:ABC transporter ATP-binding protein [Clostridia bacterium]